MNKDRYNYLYKLVDSLVDKLEIKRANISVSIGHDASVTVTISKMSNGEAFRLRNELAKLGINAIHNEYGKVYYKE